MAYRKTEKVLAQLEAKRAGIIAAAVLLFVLARIYRRMMRCRAV
jgi:hypothetical protein